ncbi:hypothetical protein [Streptomyces xanthochromogenes]|uniref:hypothetical protein n=1 Tax=Streptomyces xanthochromogenes TaxID=67384 RepID=UPI00167908E3|nr:hypothetical protein [Streptomyces xanthochromogenes]
MSEALSEALDTALSEAAEVADLVERFRAARRLRARISATDRGAMEIEQGVVWALHEGRSWADVGDLLGFSGSRAEAIARGR